LKNPIPAITDTIIGSELEVEFKKTSLAAR
jgi:hypothetical protein